MSVPLIEDLTGRGLVVEMTRQNALHNAVETDKRRHGVYSGFDPTAKALHVGHLLPLVCLFHFQLRGHRIYPLIGGATGRVGDPSGRTSERELAENEAIQHNVVKLGEYVRKFFKHAMEYAEKRLAPTSRRFYEPDIVNNIKWHQKLDMLDFLRTVGRHAKVNTMLSRQSVQSRMASSQGITFAEFSYQLLQAYDFLRLYEDKACTIQIGGSDQWGNILAGLDLINRSENLNVPGKAPQEKGFGVLTPLLTTSSGEKFGKSAGNAVWLDEHMTSVLDFYQFFLKTTDADVGKYLRMFTLLPLQEIDEVLKRHNEAPHKRIAQRLLADEVTELIHRESGLARARTATKILFGSDYSDLKADDIVEALVHDPRLVFCEDTELFSRPVAKLASAFELVPSASAARQLILSNGLSVNNVRVKDMHAKLTPSDLIDGRVAIVRAGKDKHLIISLK